MYIYTYIHICIHTHTHTHTLSGSHYDDGRYTPFVVETSIGLDRMFLAILTHSFKIEILDDGSSRNVMGIPKQLAPNKLAFLPLLKKDGLPEKAREILSILKPKFKVVYDEELVGEYDLLSSKEIKKVNFFTRLIKSINYLIWGDV